MRATTDWMSSSDAVGFMTIIIWRTPYEKIGNDALSSGARPLGLDAAALHAPAERLAKSPAVVVRVIGRPRGVRGGGRHTAAQLTGEPPALPGSARSPSACRR